MGICVNPQAIKIKIPAIGGALVFHLRSPTSDEYLKFRENRFTATVKGKKQTFRDTSGPAKIDLVNKILIDIKAENERGEPDELLYTDENGAEQTLTNQVPNWKAFIQDAHKIEAADRLEDQDAEIVGGN